MDDEERKTRIIEAEKVIISLGEKIQQIQRDIKEEWTTCQKELELIKRENELSKKAFDDSSESLKVNEKNFSNTINTFSSTLIETQNQNEARILLITQYLDDIGKEIQKNKTRFDALDEGLKSNIKINTQLVESSNLIKSNVSTTNNNVLKFHKKFIEKSLKFEELFKQFNFSISNSEKKIETLEKNNKLFFIIVIILLIVNSALILVIR